QTCALPICTDTRVQSGAQQRKLDPPCDSRRRREAGRSPPWIDSQRSRQRDRREVAEEDGEANAQQREAQRCARVLERVIRRRVQTTHRAREQTDRRARENPPAE